jgi:hypothetical protein
MLCFPPGRCRVTGDSMLVQSVLRLLAKVCHESTMRVLANETDWAGNFAILTEIQIRVRPLPPTRGIK